MLDWSLVEYVAESVCAVAAPNGTVHLCNNSNPTDLSFVGAWLGGTAVDYRRWLQLVSVSQKKKRKSRDIY